MNLVGSLKQIHKKEFFAKAASLLRFDNLRRRYDPNYLKESKYVIFGDSYALSRQVRV